MILIREKYLDLKGYLDRVTVRGLATHIDWSTFGRRYFTQVGLPFGLLQRGLAEGARVPGCLGPGGEP